MVKLKIYLENDKVLVFEDEKGKKSRCWSMPKMMSFDESIGIDINASGMRLSQTFKYSEIEVTGTIFGSVEETTTAIAELCSGFPVAAW